ncbi:MAG: T9SS type A sorting domain-containing protein, partial [Rhodothermia bacterium]|nr:T9SS type A sorting domain-containing protein [Rhodothermia bacterium]
MNRPSLTPLARLFAGLSLLSVAICPAALLAQTDMARERCDQVHSQFLGNCSFERWSVGVPANWESSSDAVTRSPDFDPNDSIEGDAYSARLEVLPSNCCPTLRSFQSGGGHRVDKAYPYFRGSFKDSLLMMDSLVVSLTVINRTTGATEGAGFTKFQTEQPPSWQEFVVPIGYTGLQPGEVADLLVEAQFGITGSPPFGDPTIGSWVLVDNVFVSSTMATAIEDIGKAPGSLVVHRNFPNPATSFTTVAFELQAPSVIEVSLFDVLGRRVFIVEVGLKSMGSHEVEIDTDRLPSGAYVYRVRAGRDVYNKLFVVA